MTRPANVFVLCTGRCGSTTLARACGHLTNFTAGHETRTHLIGPGRLAYPPRHIEIDNRLSWFLGRLEREWGDGAIYVHLTRDPEAVAQSFARRAGQGILQAYRSTIVSRSARLAPKTPTIGYCRDYVDTVTANIEAFLRGRTHVHRLTLETLPQEFDTFCDRIGAEGDLDAARQELHIRHNSS